MMSQILIIYGLSKRAGTLAEADDIKIRVKENVLKDPDIADVGIGIIEDDGDIDWHPSNRPV